MIIGDYIFTSQTFIAIRNILKNPVITESYVSLSQSVNMISRKRITGGTGSVIQQEINWWKNNLKC